MFWARMGETMLKVQCRETKGATVIDLIGRARGGPDTRAIKTIVRAQIEDGARKFVLNLSELEWMTSIGIGVLVESYASVRREGGSMVILSPTERVEQTLAMTQLIPNLFRVFRSEEEALAFTLPTGQASEEMV
jgi:anti-sigma B factor antagonist